MPATRSRAMCRTCRSLRSEAGRGYIKEPTMQEIRYLDKLIDELAKGKAMEKILRK